MNKKSSIQKKKVDSDGASAGNPGRAEGGGLLRDSNGHWVKGYARSIGFTTNVIAELWALRDGLNLALSEGIRNLIVELDARVVVDLIKSNADSSKLYSPLLCDCRCLLKEFHRVQVQHVFKEGNCPADALARWVCFMNNTFAVFNHPPSADILCLINSDLVGICNVRIVRIVCNGLTSGVDSVVYVRSP